MGLHLDRIQELQRKLYFMQIWKMTISSRGSAYRLAFMRPFQLRQLTGQSGWAVVPEGDGSAVADPFTSGD